MRCVTRLKNILLGIDGCIKGDEMSENEFRLNVLGMEQGSDILTTLEYRAGLLNLLGVEYSDDDVRNTLKWRELVLTGIGGGSAPTPGGGGFELIIEKEYSIANGWKGTSANLLDTFDLPEWFEFKNGKYLFASVDYIGDIPGWHYLGNEYVAGIYMNSGSLSLTSRIQIVKKVTNYVPTGNTVSETGIYPNLDITNHQCKIYRRYDSNNTTEMGGSYKFRIWEFGNPGGEQQK